MLDLGKQVDLVGLSNLLEDFLRLMTLLRREDSVRLGCRDGQRTRDFGKLVLLDKGWVGDISHVNTVLVMPDDVLSRVSRYEQTSASSRQRTLAPKQ
jgi:hypothetical protein